MLGTFRPGDYLTIEPASIAAIRPGDVVIYQRRDPAGEPEEVVHRVVAVTPGGLVTRGDNNPRMDNVLVTQDTLLGRVTHVERAGRTRLVWSGRPGLLCVRVRHAGRRVLQLGWRLLRIVGRRPYRWLRESGLVRRLWQPEIMRVLVTTEDSPLVKYVSGGRTVARWWPETGRFQCRRPYDLVIPCPHPRPLPIPSNPPNSGGGSGEERSSSPLAQGWERGGKGERAKAEIARLLAIPIILALSLTAALLGFASASQNAQPLPPGEALAAGHSPIHPHTQTLTLGGQQLTYSGITPLHVASGAYWDTPPVGAQVILAVDSGGPHLHIVPGPTDEVRLIVQLEGAPLAADLSGLEQYAASVHAAQDSVLQTWAARGIAVHVRRRYVHIYNGLAIVARAGDREAIARTPGVRAVYPDYEIQALLLQSVPLIGAPTVWAMHDAGGQPVLGSGVRVAVIDSGIDYDHPDLGGPGFPNTRVITGYNFISDTVDPWDDLGHGTHVAGIVGASGGITGVAPAVSFMAYKIFDDQGEGLTSDIIAAIERALDPDGDPATDDGADVLNLSLGDVGHPDDPLSQACDNAVQAGAVVVVGAGNSGPRYQSLTSPGLARRVIGVGAASKTDALWTYSSRGPVPASWAIKPDLVAPGVAISSTISGGGYVEGTGTSASTAHVAGAAALLLQLHPNWPPDWVQAALMNTALDLGRSPYDQGAGRLRADQAAATTALILPPSLSLGRVDGAQPCGRARRC